MFDSQQLSLPLPLPSPILPATAGEPLQALPPAPRALVLAFHGTGAEYFRIWIVNLLLTIVTAGLYSAWAKVRRLQYFGRNTELDGVAFDFHGNPVAILKGRLIGLALLAGYQLAFGVSSLAAGAMMAAIVLVLPWLLRGALRFRLHNTSWRGLRFGFTGTVRSAYLAFVLPILIFLLPGMVGALAIGVDELPAASWLALVGMPFLAWPVAHAAIKRYQHAHIYYGGVDALYTLKARRFWPPYLIAYGVCIGVGALMGLGLYALVRFQSAVDVSRPIATMALLTAFYSAILGSIPFVQGRIGNLVWSHTGFPDMAIASDMTFRGLFKLHAVNVVLTLLTVGLFHPFAQVRAHRYRLAHLHVTTTVDFDTLLDARARRDVNAAGDGAADFLGVDFGL